jgi:hypothetical protein
VKHTRIIVTHYGGPMHFGWLKKVPEPKGGEARKVQAAGVSSSREGITEV